MEKNTTKIGKSSKAIGATSSGKQVYKNFENEAHGSFTKQDHIDAINLFCATTAGKKHMTSAQRWQVYLHQQAASTKK